MIYNPNKLLAEVFPKNFFSGKILTSGLELKKDIMQAVLKSSLMNEREVSSTVYKVVEVYNNKIEKLKKLGEKSYKKMALNGEKLMKNRLENAVLFNEITQLKNEHEGQFYRWLPSSAKEPEPEHQLLYGKIFKVGEGDKDGNMPTERYGCRCGIEFLSEPQKIKELKEIKEPDIPESSEFREVTAEGLEQEINILNSKIEDLKRLEENLKLPKKLKPEQLEKMVKDSGFSFSTYHANTGSYYMTIDLDSLENEALRNKLIKRFNDSSVRISIRDHWNHSADYVKPDIDIFVDTPNNWQDQTAYLIEKLELKGGITGKVSKYAKMEADVAKFESEAYQVQSKLREFKEAEKLAQKAKEISEVGSGKVLSDEEFNKLSDEAKKAYRFKQNLGIDDEIIRNKVKNNPELLAEWTRLYAETGSRGKRHRAEFKNRLK